MKQIGARQEAGRIGGIGPCGRELCCAAWMSNFISVSTSAARYQDISLNPLKLAGQCAKLKCCLNYEVDSYVEAGKRIPSREITLETMDATYYFFKADILSGQIAYSTDKTFAANLVTISGKRAFEVINMNKKGIKPEKLDEEKVENEKVKPADLLEQESVTRFDRSEQQKENKKKKKKNKPQQQPAQQAEQNKPKQQETQQEKKPKQQQAQNNNQSNQNKEQNNQNKEQNNEQKRPAKNRNNKNRKRNQNPNQNPNQEKKEQVSDKG